MRRARRLDGDGRDDVRDGAVLGEPVDQRAGLLLGPRHEHAPAEERLVLEPRAGLAAAPAASPRRRRAEPASSGGAEHVGELAERGRDGPLLHGGARRRHATGRLRVGAGGEQAGGGGEHVLGAVEHDEGVVLGGVPGPVDAGRRAGARRRTRRLRPGSAGRRRTRGRRWRAGRRGRPRRGCRPCGRRAISSARPVKVAGSPSMRRTTRRPERAARDDELGAIGAGHRLAVLAEAGVEDLDVRPAVGCEQGLTAGLVRDDDVGGGEPVDGAKRQQALVTGAGTDERDLAQPGTAGGGVTVRGNSLVTFSGAGRAEPAVDGAVDRAGRSAGPGWARPGRCASRRRRGADGARAHSRRPRRAARPGRSRRPRVGRPDR